MKIHSRRPDFTDLEMLRELQLTPFLSQSKSRPDLLFPAEFGDFSELIIQDVLF